MIAVIINKGLATLREIKEDYGMGDVWDLYEIAVVNGYNEYLANSRE